MKRRTFFKGTAAGAAAAAAPAIWSEAKAQARNETLLIVAESPPNSMDIHGVGANRPAYEVSWNTYDRLMTYGVKKDANGNDHYDYTKLEPELADRMGPQAATSVTFKLRKDAKFHDGTPVTAKDVKWSFDRAVTVGGFPTFQMKAGSLEKPEQFVVVDDHTFRVEFIRDDKLTMPDIGVPVPVIMNSELCKKNATAADPWAMEWCKNNHASGGAYKVESWQPGQEVVYARNDDWKNGPLPKIRRVIMRIIPSAGNRRALLERGDADMSFDLPPKDFAELQVVAQAHRDRHADRERDDVPRHERQPEAVRQRQGAPGRGLCRALPEDHGLGDVRPARMPLFGGADNKFKGVDWPQKDGYKTDIAKAKALMAEAGYPTGFETTLSFDLGLASTNEPLAILVQESLAQIGIKTTINKIPGANWRGELLKKNMPMIINALRRLAELSGVLLLLVLSRPERRVQHDGLQEPGDGHADRQGALHHGAGVRGGGEGLHRHRLRGGAARADLPAAAQRGDAEERHRLPLLVPPPARLPAIGEGLTDPPSYGAG